MKKVLFIVLMLSIFNVFADTCSKEELARLKDIANQVELTYEYEKKYKEVGDTSFLYHEYSVIVSNLNKEIKVNYENNYLTGDYKTFKEIGNNKGKMTGFEEGEKVVVTIRAYTKDACSGKELAKKTIKLPYMNPYYYQFDNCDEFSDFKYCHPNLDEDIHYDKFISEFNKYYAKRNGTIIDSDDNKNDTSNNSIVMWIVIGCILIFIILIIALFTKKNKKNALCFLIMFLINLSIVGVKAGYNNCYGPPWDCDPSFHLPPDENGNVYNNKNNNNSNDKDSSCPTRTEHRACYNSPSGDNYETDLTIDCNGKIIDKIRTACSSSGGGDDDYSRPPVVVNYKCWRMDKGNGEYDYKWATNSPGKNYKVVSNITTKDECDIADPKLCTVTSSIGSVNPKYVCENSISTDTVKTGKSCSVDSTTFYDYKCTEQYIANYKPELKNRVLSIHTDRNGISEGFMYDINLSVVKMCEGIFYDDVYNSAYNRAKSKLDRAKENLKNATTKDEKENAEKDVATYQNMITEIKEYVNTYNENYNTLNEITDKNSDIHGTIKIKYQKNDSKKSNEFSDAEFDFDVIMVAKTVEWLKKNDACRSAQSVDQFVSTEKLISDCTSSCDSNADSYRSACESNCKGNESCILDNCSLNRMSCMLYCVSKYKNTDTLEECKETNNQEITLVDGSKVSPYNINVTEHYLLTAPMAYMADNGKVVRTVKMGENYDNKNGYSEGERKFYLDNVKAGDNYKITTVISNLGVNKGSSITNENCDFNVVNSKELYRIIDVDNPFVNNQRLGELDNNWKNSIYDFTGITNEKKAPLFTFDLSREDIGNIKDDNKKNNSYLGLCRDDTVKTGVIGRICEEIHSK